jgi:hypothetical protein
MLQLPDMEASCEYRCLASNKSKIFKRHLSSTIKCNEGTGIFKHWTSQSSLCALYISIWHHSGTTHIKTIFSFWSGVGKHFTGNVLCSSEDSVTLFIHILHFFTINFYVLQTSKWKTPEEWNLNNEGAREWVPPVPIPYDQETLCTERHKRHERCEVQHHLRRKLFPQEQDAKQCPPS